MSAEYSFGECMGECIFHVDIVASSGEPSACDVAEFTASGHSDSDAVRANRGVLTPAGNERAHTLALLLESTLLRDTYGCPDCADGGASHVTLLRQAETSVHDYEYQKPPDDQLRRHRWPGRLAPADGN